MTKEHIERILFLSKKLMELAQQYKDALEKDEVFEVTKSLLLQIKDVEKQIVELQAAEKAALN